MKANVGEELRWRWTVTLFVICAPSRRLPGEAVPGRRLFGAPVLCVSLLESVWLIILLFPRSCTQEYSFV